MADTCVKAQDMNARISKLQEEYQELITEFNNGEQLEYWPVDNYGKIKGEVSDVLFVLLHIASKKGWKPFDLLHMATTKMLSRMNDPEYIAKN